MLLAVVGGVFGFLWWKKLPPFAKKVATTPAGTNQQTDSADTLTHEEKQLQALRAKFLKGKHHNIGPNERIKIVRVIPSDENGTNKPSYQVQRKSKKLETWTEEKLIDLVTQEQKRRDDDDNDKLGFKFEVGQEVKMGFGSSGVFSNLKMDYKPKTAKIVEQRAPKQYRLEGDNGFQLYIFTSGVVCGGTLSKDLFIDEAKLQKVHAKVGTAKR